MPGHQSQSYSKTYSNFAGFLTSQAIVRDNPQNPTPAVLQDASSVAKVGTDSHITKISRFRQLSRYDGAL
jgi:hypothetical protein